MSETGDNKNKKFVFPEELLERINECSFGGFVLFCFDDSSEPEVFSKIDNNVNAMALQYFIRNWSKSLDEANIENSKAQLLLEEMPPIDEDGEEEV